MPTSLPVTVYTPSSALKEPGKLLAGMFAGLRDGRGLAWRLFIRDTKAAYRQSVLGYVWAFLPPLATAATFVFLNSQRILAVGETPVPYAAYVLIGTVLWQSFVDALNSPIRAATTSRSMLVKINFPREALILAGLLGVLFNFAIRLVLLVAVFLLYDVPLTASVLLFPLGFAAVILLGLSLGVVVTPLALLYTDVARGISIITGFWLFLTPVVYPPPQSGLAAYLTTMNPVSPVIVTARDWLISQPPVHLDGFLGVTAFAAVLLLVGWVLYHVALPHLIERMGG
jgi:lipopolysaccharide transport system permease protein